MNATIPRNPLPITIIEYGLLFLIIVTPLAFGSVHVWAYTIMEVLVLLLLLTHLLSHLLPRSFTFKTQPVNPNNAMNPTNAWRSSFIVPFALFLVLILFQMVPFPASVIKHLSPNTLALYQQTLEPSKDKGLRSEDRETDLVHRSSSLELRTLTIYPHATKTAFLKFFICVSVFFLIITTITTTRQLRRMVLTIIFTGTGVAFLALCQMLSKSDKIYGFWQSQYKAGSYGGPFINPNHLAGYLEMVIPLAIGFLVSREVPAMIRTARNWKQRLSLLESWLAKNILLVFIIVLMASALFISVSRGGILSFVFSLGLFSLLLGTQKLRQGKRKLVLLISGLIFICLLWLGIGPVVTELATLGDPKNASGERPRVWKDTFALARDFPVFGVGLGNFQTLFPKYNTLSTRTLWEHAHNDYVEMLADTGWMGLLLFFGGIWVLLVTILKEWEKRHNFFLSSITLGGFIGVISLLCHSLVEFNFHIPANFFLFFVILGLSVAAVYLKRREEESYPLSIRNSFFSPGIKKTIIIANALIVVFLLFLVTKDYLAYHFFMNYQSLAKEEGMRNEDQNSRISHRPSFLVPLYRAIFFDPGNAQYHFEMGNYYAKKMSESWRRGSWKLEEEHWVFDAEKNIRFCGLEALRAYVDAVKLSPANAWHHFYLGWTVRELKRFSDVTHHPISLPKAFDMETEFSRALMLYPNNNDIKNYIKAVNSKK